MYCRLGLSRDRLNTERTDTWYPELPCPAENNGAEKGSILHAQAQTDMYFIIFTCKPLLDSLKIKNLTSKYVG